MEEFVKINGEWYVKITPAILYFENSKDIPEYIQQEILNKAGD